VLSVVYVIFTESARGQRGTTLLRPDLADGGPAGSHPAGCFRRTGGHRLLALLLLVDAADGAVGDARL
jgi:hypothetical protein